ncbi:hypothetical protein EJ08DRAFT_693480 [Tothia fuscella]|uniref:Protein kinase domain-containing protein n=1 Tax=Tothia fuscella TaxID=1048955 RepID=A0A9P4P0H1_9PEZI|nr:hypothetical protein EJ08DRAFT_693480 [Tothia fuscella]
MLAFAHPAVIAKFADAQLAHPMPRKDFPTHTVYLSHNDFGQLYDTPDESSLLKMLSKIVDFGLAQRTDTRGGTPLISPIQVDQFHAPEVLLGTGWSYSADIWNLGVMIWELLSGKDLFQNVYDENGLYSAKHHLADMYSILGPIPVELIQREKEMRHWRWDPELTNAKG